MGGTVAAVANILVIWFGTTPGHMGLWYFTVAEIFVVLGFVGYLFLPSMVSWYKLHSLFIITT